MRTAEHRRTRTRPGSLPWVWVAVVAATAAAAAVTYTTVIAAAADVGPSVPTPGRTAALGALFVIGALGYATVITGARRQVPVRPRQRALTLFVAGSGLLQVAAVGVTCDKMPADTVAAVTGWLYAAAALALLPAVGLLVRRR